MNIQEYISSGVVELYVAGALCEEDARELESLVSQYPELRLEVEQIEKAMEAYAMANQRQPDASLRERVLAGITQNPPDQQEPVATPANEPAARESDDKPVVLSSRSNFNWFAIAASLALLIISTGIGFYFYRQNTQLQTEIAALKTNINQLDRVLNDPNTQMLVLKGNEKLPVKMPQAEIKVFWNKSTQVVSVSVANLPALAEGEQYQLWALKGDTPIDAGVFEIQSDKLIQTLKTIQSADKWAVTIEPKGGSTQPHLNKLCLFLVG